MPCISQVATSLPEFVVGREEVKDVSQKWLAHDRVAQEKFLRICAHSGVSTRRYALPHDNILGLSGLKQRAEVFEREATKLLVRTLSEAIASSGEDPADIGGLVFTSCSVPSIPAIDAAAILQTELPNTMKRIPMYQHGCAGGVIGLSLGSRLASLGKPYIVSSVELCSLVFQPENHCGAHLVGAAIFADGAAATVISPEQGSLSFVDTESHLLPDSRHLMGYDIFDDGFHLRLDRALPSALVEKAPSVVESFLKRNGKTKEDIDYWLFHPGGIKILHFLQETFSLRDEQCRWAYDVLRDHGNLSSATILYVLRAFFEDVEPQRGESVVMMGIGPGLTLELLLLEA